MKTRDEVLKTLKGELHFLRQKYGVKRLGLFGSHSRDEATEKSDIDILVAFERPIGFFDFIDLEDYLKEKLGAEVELVTEDALKPLIKPRVTRETVYV